MSEDESLKSDLLRDGVNLKGIDWALPGTDAYDDDGEDELELELSPTEAVAARAQQLQTAALIKGMLWHGSVTAVDLLFEALRDWDEIEEQKWLLNIHPVLGALPPRFTRHYDGRFVQRFLVAVVDVSAALAGNWTPLPTVAHELALRAILDQAQALEETYNLEVGDDWRRNLESVLFDDLDHELLYDADMDGIEHYAEAGLSIAPMGFEDWFTPFANRPRAAPYATHRD